jgi:thiol-disulfide isomerase/thioredoxin
MNKIKIQNSALLLLIPFAIFLFAVADAKIVHADNKVKLYFFWGKGCPHCAEEEKFLEQLKKKYPQLEVESHEVWYDRENARLFSQMAEAYGTRPEGVPTTFIGEFKPVVGYRNYELTGKIIEDRVKDCIKRGCIDPVEKLGRPAGAKDISDREEENAITLPFLGRVDTSRMSLPVLTIVLAGLDSFNPCAFFVLFTLLGILLCAKSRKRMLLIGGTFVFFSGLIYFLFMSAWLNLFLLIGEFKIVTVIAGITALIIGGINIKDFFFFKKGVSLVIPEKAKPKLFERMRNLLKATSIQSMMTGTIVLAVAANTYELLCTIGFPMIFTKVLTSHGLPKSAYYLYLVYYNVIYVIPLLFIVLVFSITLGAKKLTEWQGQILKLISGFMMLGLGLILFIDPALFNNIFVATGLLAITLASAGVIIFIMKKVTYKTKIKK